MTTRSYHRPPASSTRSQRQPLIPFDIRPSSKSPRTPMASVKMPSTPAASASTTSSSSSSTSAATPASSLITESSLTPAPFHGKDTENSQDWVTYFTRYVTFKQLPQSASLALFALLMRGGANTWFCSLSDETRSDYDAVVDRFRAKYAPAPISLWRRASELWNRDQRPDESAEDYVSDMMRKARDVGAEPPMTRYAIVRGLRPQLRTYVMQQNPTTTAELLDAAKVAEATIVDSGPSVSSEILEAISRLEQRVAAPVDTMRRVDTRRRSPAPFGRSPLTSRPSVRFDDRRQPPPFNGYRGRDRGRTPPPAPAPSQMSAGPLAPRPPSQAGCRNCGRVHAANACFAFGKQCHNCGKRNHFAVCCRSARRSE